jgi:hypothetical protein
MNTSYPYKIKQIGSRIRNFDVAVWKQNAKRIALKAIHAKFSQNNHLKMRLLSTGDKCIVEATKDSYWGIGMSLREVGILDQSNWKNNGGTMNEVLTHIRNNLHVKIS